MTWFHWLVLIAAVLAITAVGLTVFGSMRWAEVTKSLIACLEAGRKPPSHATVTRYDASQIEGLPAPVQRYFRAALTPGQAIVSAATIEISGTFNLSATGEQWRPFASRQRITTSRPGFLWDAGISMLPGLTVRIGPCELACRRIDARRSTNADEFANLRDMAVRADWRRRIGRR